jgi:hypothetical protein
MNQCLVLHVFSKSWKLVSCVKQYLVTQCYFWCIGTHTLSYHWKVKWDPYARRRWMRPENGFSQAYILITRIPVIISLMNRARSSVLFEISSRKIPEYFPTRSGHGYSEIVISIKADADTACEIFWLLTLEWHEHGHESNPSKARDPDLAPKDVSEERELGWAHNDVTLEEETHIKLIDIISHQIDNVAQTCLPFCCTTESESLWMRLEDPFWKDISLNEQGIPLRWIWLKICILMYLRCWTMFEWPSKR